MERSRSKRYYYDQDYESETLHSRNKPRYGGSNSYGGGGGAGGGGGGGGGGHRYAPSYHRRSSSAVNDGGGGGGRKMDNSLMVTTSYRILCHDVKAGGVIGKSGSIIKAIRQHTGAWINVHEVIPGDEERIIEISDTRRRDPDGRIPSFSPAQEALFLIHERILETEMVGGGFGGPMVEEEYDDYRGGGGNGNKVVTRLVVSRMHVGSLLGKGGKIIEQMRMETKTHIRILPRDHTLPRCIAMSEEIVQIVGDMNAVKNAVSIISSRLRESQHRDRTNFHNRLHSPDRFFPDDDFHGNNPARRPSLDRPNYGSRYSAGGPRINNRPSRALGYVGEHGPAPVSDNAQSFSWEDLVFRILCPVGKLDSVVGETDGIVDLLQNEIGVNVDVTEKVAGSDEHIIIVSSDEGPEDELFPAQEALLHIQTRIADLIPDKENIITTRLLLQSDEIGCLGLKDGLLELGKVGAVKIVLLSREELPEGIAGQDEILQIVGEIKASREALLEVTSRVRSYIYREFLDKEAPGPNVSAPNPAISTKLKEPVPDNVTPVESKAGNGLAVSAHQETLAAEVTPKVKDPVVPVVETVKQNETERREEPQPSGLNKMAMTLVTRSTLEVVIPPHAATQLATKSRKLALISDLSGASVKLIDDRPDSTEKIIQISGTPEQAERAQSLLQGFILSTEEDGP